MSSAKPKKTPRVPENAPISDLERQIMDEMQSKFGSLIAKHRTSEGTLLRFIRGYKDDPKPKEKSIEMLGESLKWRDEVNVDKIMATVHPKTEKFKLMWQSGIHGESRDGHPIYIDRLGAISPSGIQKEFTMDDIMLFHIQMMERLVAYKDRLSAERGTRIYKQVVIIDVKGLGFSHLGDNFLGPMKKMIHIDQYYYPEQLWTMFVVNAGLMVKTAWALVSPFLDPITKANINFGNDKLLEWIDKGQLPQYLGGDCRCEGGKCLISPFVAGPSDGKGGLTPSSFNLLTAPGENKEPSISNAPRDSQLIDDSNQPLTSPQPSPAQ